MNTKKILLVLSIVSTLAACKGECENGQRAYLSESPVWTQTLRAFAPMTNVRLNNFTSFSGAHCGYVSDEEVCLNSGSNPPHMLCDGREFAFKDPCSSRISFLAEDRVFDIPAVLAPEGRKGYINDIRSIGSTVSVREGKLVFQLEFESDGVEIVSRCHNNFFCFTGDPAFHLDNMTIDALFELSAQSGEIVYSDVDVEVNADFRNSGMCRNNLFAAFCGNRKQEIFGNIESQFRSHLLDSDIRSALSDGIHLAIMTSTGAIEHISEGGITALEIVPTSGQLFLQQSCRS